MPNLLSINNYHYIRGGSEAIFFRHIDLFKDLGWDTASMSMMHPQNLPSEWEKYFVDEIELGRSYSLGTKMLNGGKIIYSYEARNKLCELLNQFTPDIAHIHNIYHHISPSVLPVLKEKGIPVVMTAHDLKLGCPAYKMYNQHGICERCKDGNYMHLIRNKCIHGSTVLSTLVAIESYTHRQSGIYRKNIDRIIVPSKFYHHKLQEWGWEKELLTYIPNFIDTELYEARPEPGAYFLYFGRLSVEKGLKTLISSARNSGIHLKIAGTGPQEEELKELNKTLKGPGKVEFLGYLTNSNLTDLVKNSKAVVIPSEWYENSPVSLFEAYAMGKVVIGADIGGIPELITPETGLTFKSGSEEELSEKLIEVDGWDASKIAQMGRQSRVLAETEYSSLTYRERILDLYRELSPVLQ